MEPSWQPGATKTSATAVSSSSGVHTSKHSSSRDWRTVHSIFKRGGGPRPSERVRRAAATPDDVREGYLVWDLAQTRRCQTSVRTKETQRREVRLRSQKCILLHTQTYTLLHYKHTHLCKDVTHWERPQSYTWLCVLQIVVIICQCCDHQHFFFFFNKSSS